MANDQGELKDQSIGDLHSSKLEKDMTDEVQYEGREDYDMDVDRMVNEGLGGGQVTLQNGLIGSSTTDTMGNVEEME